MAARARLELALHLHQPEGQLWVQSLLESGLVDQLGEIGGYLVLPREAHDCLQPTQLQTRQLELPSGHVESPGRGPARPHSRTGVCGLREVGGGRGRPQCADHSSDEQNTDHDTQAVEADALRFGAALHPSPHVVRCRSHMKSYAHDLVSRSLSSSHPRFRRSSLRGGPAQSPSRGPTTSPYRTR